jgi:predicted ArsR family transcriptional regulator
MTKSLKPKTTKKDQLIRLLGAKSGRRADDLSKTLGWQPHTLRAAVSGLRKAGYHVSCEKHGTGSAKYRIISAPDIAAASMSEVA